MTMSCIPESVILILIIIGFGIAIGWALFPFMLCNALNNIADAIRFLKKKDE